MGSEGEKRFRKRTSRVLIVGIRQSCLNHSAKVDMFQAKLLLRRYDGDSSDTVRSIAQESSMA